MPMPMTCECRELRERMNSFRSSNWKNGVWFMDKCRMFITHAQNPRLNPKKRQLASISYIECRHPYVFLCRWRNNRSWVTTNLWIVFTRFTHKTNPRHFASQTRIVSHFSRYTTCSSITTIFPVFDRVTTHSTTFKTRWFWMKYSI